ncbi:hypothetical protein D1819_01420 [Pseudoalteromonas tunicata]|nr:hypothetical protein D1819_01420 [Pseudoalteromonas tunicata]
MIFCIGGVLQNNRCGKTRHSTIKFAAVLFFNSEKKPCLCKIPYKFTQVLLCSEVKNDKQHKN